MTRTAGEPGASGLPARDETEAERYDRNWNELLQELRVAQTGGQLLFAFLLTVAFSERFAREGERLHAIYVVTLLLTTLATGLLIAPAAYHRHYFQGGVKGEVVRVGHRLAEAGLVVLALAISGAVLLVLYVTLGPALGWAFALATLAMLGLLWFSIPVLRHTRTTNR